MIKAIFLAPVIALGLAASHRIPGHGAWSQPAVQPATQTTETVYLAQLVFTDPADGFSGSGRPVSRTSGGDRSPACTAQLIALVPGPDVLGVDCGTPSMAALALTTVANPTMWIHIPDLEIPTQGQLALMDENQRALSIQIVDLPMAAGVVGLPLEISLEINQTYYWVFSLMTHLDSPSDNPRVEGKLRRIESTDTITYALNSSRTVREKAEVWANHGIWHDALTTLVQLQQTSPETTQQDWVSFLESVGLGVIAHTPLQGCCQAQLTP